MAKVVRAFSIDADVAAMIDRIANRQATWDHKPNKSLTVNRALMWYYLDTSIAEEFNKLELCLLESEKLVESLTKEISVIKNGGVKHHLASFCSLLLMKVGLKSRKTLEHRKTLEQDSD